MIPILGSLSAPNFPFSEWLTNSVFVAALVLLIVLSVAISATANMQMVPGKLQNGFEFVIEFLYSQVEGIVGKHVAPKAFPLLATIFIFILVSNWFGLLPLVGTIGWGDSPTPLTLEGHPKVPLLRPPTADLNFTLGIALVFMIVWAWITYREVGVIGFIKHTFGPKGGLTGFMGMIVAVIFFIVGLIEIVSIAFRPVSLSLRLFGNVFAGESLLHTMANLGEQFGLSAIPAFLMSVALPLPFYFLELLVGVLQAMVFTLLCAVYIQLSTAHEDH